MLRSNVFKIPSVANRPLVGRNERLMCRTCAVSTLGVLLAFTPLRFGRGCWWDWVRLLVERVMTAPAWRWEAPSLRKST
jgi:hypothetical protein